MQDPSSRYELVRVGHGSIHTPTQFLIDFVRTFLLNIGKNIVHDVWTSQLQDRNLVLGADTCPIPSREYPIIDVPLQVAT